MINFHKLSKKIIPFIPSKFYLLFSLAKHYLFHGYAIPSYSQDGTDTILYSLLKNRQSGFYVDVGANHPVWTSNTLLFYQLGWRGINIDATPRSMRLFKIMRWRDINLETAVSNTTLPLTLTIFNSSAINSVHGIRLPDQLVREKFKVLREIVLFPLPLATILNHHLPPNQSIDFFSIDTEGHDLHVLKSNDWAKYRPKIIVVEQSFKNFRALITSKIYQFLKDKKYSFFANTSCNVIYVDHIFLQSLSK